MDNEEQQKFAEYQDKVVKIAAALEAEVETLKEKIATHTDELERYNESLPKIASILDRTGQLGNYDSKEDFVKSAENTPSVLGHVFEKFQNKMAVSSIGHNSKQASYTGSSSDPIVEMALGKQ